MKLMESVKTAGGCLIGIAISCGLILLLVLFLNGAAWVSDKVLPVLDMINIWSFALVLLSGLILAWSRKTRTYWGVAMFLWSYFCLVDLWMYSLLVCLSLWGVFWCVVGLLFGGVGIIPLALIASLFKGQWVAFFTIFVLGIIMLVARIGGMVLAGVDEP